MQAELQLNSLNAKFVAFHPTSVQLLGSHQQLFVAVGVDQVGLVVFAHEKLCLALVLLNHCQFSNDYAVLNPEI